MKIVVLENCSLFYGAIEALKEISFAVEEGEIFGLVGSDGAGKSSLLRLLATMLRPSAGKITVAGWDVITNKKEVKSTVGYMPQKFALYNDLTVEENFAFFLDVFGIGGKERKKKMEKYLGFSGLLPFCHRRAKDLSGGMKQKLGLACALVHEPQILLLDEPTCGVDPVSRQEFWELIMGMKEEGKTIIIATSYLEEGERCNRLAIMHEGALLAVSKPEYIIASAGSLEEGIVRLIEQKMGHE
ncbi:MAG: ABC transporter ATP-binding protein [Syntrophales bacterium]|nr:ABC transporter ATP-binding protein [Syntrophales bacterium]